MPMAAQPVFALAPRRITRREQRPEPVRVVLHLEVSDLVLDDVVEDLGRRQEEAVVEAHRAARGAGRPACPLPSDREAGVANAGAGRGGGAPGAPLPPPAGGGPPPRRGP